MNLKKININQALIAFLLFLCSAFALILAYISQYTFDLQPCILCIYQRIPFFLVIFISFIIFFSKINQNFSNILINLMIFLLLFNVFLALYHVGIEEKIFTFFGCDSTVKTNLNIEDLKKVLLQTKAIRCDEPQFKLFGISIAGYNVIYCLIVAIMAIILNKKKLR